jgi:putative transport protein
VRAVAAALAAQQRRRARPLEHRTLVVDNPNLTGISIDDIPSRAETGVIVSRHRRVGETDVQVATGGMLLQHGDSILAVGTGDMLDKFQRVVGRRSDEDLYRAPGKVTQRRIVVTAQGGARRHDRRRGRARRAMRGRRHPRDARTSS